jgi:hypothetical protein
MTDVLEKLDSGNASVEHVSDSIPERLRHYFRVENGLPRHGEERGWRLVFDELLVRPERGIPRIVREAEFADELVPSFPKSGGAVVGHFAFSRRYSSNSRTASRNSAPRYAFGAN